MIHKVGIVCRNVRSESNQVEKKSPPCNYFVNLYKLPLTSWNCTSIYIVPSSTTLLKQVVFVRLHVSPLKISLTYLSTGYFVEVLPLALLQGLSESGRLVNTVLFGLLFLLTVAEFHHYWRGNNNQTYRSPQTANLLFSYTLRIAFHRQYWHTIVLAHLQSLNTILHVHPILHATQYHTASSWLPVHRTSVSRP